MWPWSAVTSYEPSMKCAGTGLCCTPHMEKLINWPCLQRGPRSGDFPAALSTLGTHTLTSKYHPPERSQDSLDGYFQRG